jgi:hypothetical protein
MKLWTTTLAAGAILAVAAPAGYAANGNFPDDPSSNAGPVVVHRSVSAPTAIPSTLAHIQEPGSVSVTPVKLLRDKRQAAKIKVLAARNQALVATLKLLVAENKSLSEQLQAVLRPVPLPPVETPISNDLTGGDLASAADPGSEDC